ncbi:hypothetical protein AB1Y20_006646 [Prymnesium parvum]|uniref:Uncharacterized protein n=1 Tax=Prymnesium parvum TaxID=97485 RepID=A0AB34J0X6_PRYPA
MRPTYQEVPRGPGLCVRRCELVGDEEHAGEAAAAAGQAGRVSRKRHAGAHEASAPSQRARAERQTEESSPPPSLRRIQQDDATRCAHGTVLASAYPFAERCTPRTCPGWELAMYALILLKVCLPAASASREETDLAMHAAFPASALNLTGSRLASAVNEAPATLGLVLQTLRHLAVSHMSEIAHFADVLPTWCMHEVCMSPEMLHRFLLRIYHCDPRYCPHRTRRWVCFRPQVNLILEQVELRSLLASVSAHLADELGAAQLPSGLSHWWELWRMRASISLPAVFISDLAASAVQPAPAAMPCGPSDGMNNGPCPGAEPSTEIGQLQAEVSRLQAELGRANTELESARAALASKLSVECPFSAEGFQAAASALMAELDHAVEHPREATDLLFAGGLTGLLTMDKQIWRLTHEVLDAALSRLPELKDELEKQMITRRGLVLAKLRKSFLFVIELARTRTQKDAAACVLPWALAVQQVALNVPPSAMEGLRAVLGHSVSYRRAWQFLRDLTVVIVRSYPTWWPGKCVGFADDNFQKERHRTRQRLGQYNNMDTNVLQQADFSIS